MKKETNIILSVIFIAALAGAGSWFYINNSASAGPVIEIVMANNSYSQNELNIKKGQTVKFINNGIDDYWPASNIHPDHAVYPEFDPERPIKPGESWSFKFGRAGKWYFHDHIHYPDVTGFVNVSE